MMMGMTRTPLVTPRYFRVGRSAPRSVTSDSCTESEARGPGFERASAMDGPRGCRPSRRHGFTRADAHCHTLPRTRPGGPAQREGWAGGLPQPRGEVGADAAREGEARRAWR